MEYLFGKLGLTKLMGIVLILLLAFDLGSLMRGTTSRMLNLVLVFKPNEIYYQFIEDAHVGEHKSLWRQTEAYIKEYNPTFYEEISELDFTIFDNGIHFDSYYYGIESRTAVLTRKRAQGDINDSDITKIKFGLVLHRMGSRETIPKWHIVEVGSTVSPANHKPTEFEFQAHHGSIPARTILSLYEIPFAMYTDKDGDKSGKDTRNMLVSGKQSPRSGVGNNRGGTVNIIGMPYAAFGLEMKERDQTDTIRLEGEGSYSSIVSHEHLQELGDVLTKFPKFRLWPLDPIHYTGDHWFLEKGDLVERQGGEHQHWNLKTSPRYPEKTETGIVLFAKKPKIKTKEFKIKIWARKSSGKRVIWNSELDYVLDSNPPFESHILYTEFKSHESHVFNVDDSLLHRFLIDSNEEFDKT